MSNDDFGMDSLLETFIHETDEMLEQLDEILLDSERAGSISEDNINSIFRITHTIKGSAAMMSYNSISVLAHSVEDVFFILRESPSKLSLIFNTIFDLVFKASDFFKAELEKLQDEEYIEGDPSELINQLKQQISILKDEAPSKEQTGSESSTVNSETDNELTGNDVSKILVFFDNDCAMENIRAFMLLNQVKPFCNEVSSIPKNPENDPDNANKIIQDGFTIICKPTNSIDEVLSVIESSFNIKSYELLHTDSDANGSPEGQNPKSTPKDSKEEQNIKPTGKKFSSNAKGVKQSLISVNLSKLDILMDLVGEIVTAESMITNNPDLKDLHLESFSKSIRELRKLTDELQDIVMSIRMVPLQGTFHKMDRIVRDMSKKLGKKADLIMEGGDTEVDKTINDAIVDPLMHMIRNSMDHAIETPEERIAVGKSEVGTVKLVAKNTGGEIRITVSDDGCGLDPEKLLKKASDNGILTKPESAYTDKEIYQLIMLPGFSTNSNVTEYSGRGVGMDVVRKNLEQVGGTISIDSEKGIGTTFTIKIPLTLAIVDGMNISVGDSVFTIPITAIRQSFKVTDSSQITINTDGSEMIVMRGECYPITRLCNVFDIDNGINDITEGIMLQVDSNKGGYCIFADELLGEYQIVVKPFPIYLNKFDLKNQGLSGCSILGNGSISLILDVNTLKKN